VSFSGGKGIRGPQSTGILAGRRDLVRAAASNASPNQALGRAAKTSKEEIAGLVVALELFMAEDESAEMKHYADVCTAIVEALADIPGVRAVVEQDSVNRVIPHAVLYFTSDWSGPSGHAVQVALAQGEPHIYVQQGAHQGGYFDEIAVDPINLQPGDETIVAERLREELTRRWRGAAAPRSSHLASRLRYNPAPWSPCRILRGIPSEGFWSPSSWGPSTTTPGS
jgi:L-seryl-tRNA(Ser) seleniumtransferase